MSREEEQKSKDECASCGCEDKRGLSIRRGMSIAMKKGFECLWITVKGIVKTEAYPHVD